MGIEVGTKLVGLDVKKEMLSLENRKTEQEGEHKDKQSSSTPL